MMGRASTRPGHRKLNTNLLWWTGRCTRASRCWLTELGPGERAIIDVGPESSRWFDDSVRLLVPTSVSLSEPSVSYSSDSDLNDFDLRRARPRTFVYWSTSHCNRFAPHEIFREREEYERWLITFLQKIFSKLLDFKYNSYYTIEILRNIDWKLIDPKSASINWKRIFSSICRVYRTLNILILLASLIFQHWYLYIMSYYFEL